MGAKDSKMRHFFHKDDYHSFQNYSPPDSILFTHFNAVEKSTNAMVSIFTYAFRENDVASKRASIGYDATVPIKPTLPEKWIISNALQRLKTLRHPGILKFKEAIMTNSYLYVITEPVIPLSRILNELPPEEVALGVHSVLKTVSFLHANSLCHNNLQLSSLYISLRERQFLVGGLEFTNPFQDMTRLFTRSLAACIPRDMIPPEDTDPHVLSGTCPEARDYFAMGILLSVLLERWVEQNDAGANAVFDWRELQRLADMMMSMNPGKRISIDTVLMDPVFAKNQFIYIAYDFLRNVRAFGAEEKVAGFKKILALVNTLPHSTVTAYLLPQILNTELFSEPGIEVVLRDLFSQKTAFRNASAPGILPPSIFVHFVLPFVSKSIKRREFDVRRVMLRLFPCYFEELFQSDPQHFLACILPEILIGLNESNEEIYAQTLCAVTLAIPHIYQYEVLTAATSNTSVTSTKQQRQLQRTLSTAGHAKFNPVPKSSGSRSLFTPIPARVLIESFVTPRVLNSVHDGDLAVDTKDMLLLRFTNMWKDLCRVEQRVPGITPVLEGLLHVFKTILSILPDERKEVFITEMLVGTSRTGEEHWMPKVLEILIPFLASCEENLRLVIADILMQTITIVAQYPRQPLTHDSSNTTAITQRKIERFGNAIVHTGPRRNSTTSLESAVKDNPESPKPFKKHPQEWGEHASPTLEVSRHDLEARLPGIKDLPMLPCKARPSGGFESGGVLRALNKSRSGGRLKREDTGARAQPSQEFIEVSLDDSAPLGLLFPRGEMKERSPIERGDTARSIATVDPGVEESIDRVCVEGMADVSLSAMWRRGESLTHEVLEAFTS
ncbi:Protein-associating with the carboxyl-terminal domain of ezrin [Chytriomyces hyalinus]|nr:Protein-associating with the carboxyl-terminal domain of ezrin [Chytriomyces hyalinus]